MNFKLSDCKNRAHADALILPFWKTPEGVECALKSCEWTPPRLSQLLALQDFKGKQGETFYFFDEQLSEKRLILLGLGPKEKISSEILRCSYASLIKLCMTKRWSILNIPLPGIDTMSLEEVLVGISEGILLTNYQFDAPKKKEEDQSCLVNTINWIGIAEKELKTLNQVSMISQGINLTRNLVNGNADDVTPEYLKNCAEELTQTYPELKATIFDKTRLQKENLDLLLAVSRGSDVEPYLIILEYKGDPSSSKHTILVGKGVTYDTGGLNLKPTGSMEMMKCDMAGAAVCLGAMQAVAALKLKVNFTIVIPTTENGIDAKSFKPGDVYRSYSGKTVEVTNTDAEGRLILADALSYASKNLSPTCLIDIATLTGAIDIALGVEASGLMSTCDDLAASLLRAGEVTAERLWRMPLFEEYKERLKSDFADLKSWNGRAGSANVAAVFLNQFVGENIPWAHLDIASTAYTTEAKKYWPKNATGFGVRLIVNFLQN